MLESLKPALGIFLMLSIATSVWCQSKTAFSLLSESTTLSKENSKRTGPKYKKAKEIYDRLVEARGDRRFPVPAFTMSTSQQNVAYLEADGLSIGLEEKAYDLFMSLGELEGENAIAAILGHELTHFYEKHQWGSAFAEENLDLQVGKTIDAQNTNTSLRLSYKVINETQSDYLGGFLAYSAGYWVYEGLPHLYDRIYKAYGLNDKMQGYAEREDRKALATKSLAKLKDLIEVFEMANLMTALGYYNNARSFYRHILFEYQSREIYNNLGILTVLESFQYMTKDETKYRIPLELDLNFRSGTKDGYATRDSIKKALLQEALIYFENAVSMDSEYAPGYLNMACAYYLLGDYRRAQFYAEVEAKQKALLSPEKFVNTSTDAIILLALIAEKNGQKEKAIQQLTALKNDPTASYNLLVMKGQRPPTPSKEDGPEYEEIDGIENTYTAYRNLKRQAKRMELFGTLDFDVIEKAKKGNYELKNSKIYRCDPPSGDESPSVFIHITDPGYRGETLDGFKANETTIDEIIDEYGEPNMRYKTTAGEIIVYEEMLFIIDKNRKISRWAKFLTKS